eukprot:746073-Hanusia_phi.AAC.6
MALSMVVVAPGRWRKGRWTGRGRKEDGQGGGGRKMDREGEEGKPDEMDQKTKRQQRKGERD